MSEARIKILIADDHDLIRQGLRTVLDYENDLTVVGKAKNGEEVLTMVKLYTPDILFMDMNRPILSGLEVLKAIKKDALEVKVLFLTVEDDRQTLIKAIEIGADGYVLKGSSTKELVEAIRIVKADENYIDKSLVSTLFNKVNKEEKQQSVFDDLAERDLEILYHISQGLSNREVADLLYLSEKTVKNYSSRIFRKLDVKDRVQATIFAIENGLDQYFNKKKAPK